MDNLIQRLEQIVSEIASPVVSGQTALAQGAGASKSVVNQWLSGKIKSIDIRFALEIERKLGYSHVWLMTGSGEKKVQPGANVVYVDRLVQHPPTYSWISSEEARLITLYRTTTDVGRAEIMEEAELSERAIKAPTLISNKL